MNGRLASNDFVAAMRGLTAPVAENVCSFLSNPRGYIKTAHDKTNGRDELYGHYYTRHRVHMRRTLKGASLLGGSVICSTLYAGFQQTAEVIVGIGAPAAAIYAGMRIYGTLSGSRFPRNNR